MNATLELEQEANRNLHNSAYRHIYKEELDKTLQDKRKGNRTLLDKNRI